MQDICYSVCDCARWKTPVLDGAWPQSCGGLSTTDGTGVRSHGWKPRRSLQGRKMERSWFVTVLTITICWASAFARTAERYTRGSSTARGPSAFTRSLVPMAISLSWSWSSGQLMTQRPGCFATREHVLSGRRHSPCVWRVPCQGLRRSGRCSTCVGSSSASTPGSTTSSVCPYRPLSKAGSRNDHTE